MYSSYGYGSASSAISTGSLLLIFLEVVVLIAVVVAFLMATNLFIEAAKRKGHYENGAGLLWFIGIFATPIAVGLYVLSLPDLKDHTEAKQEAVEATLPTV